MFKIVFAGRKVSKYYLVYILGDELMCQKNWFGRR